MKIVLSAMICLFAVGCTATQLQPTAMPIPTLTPTESPCDDDKIASYINDYSNKYSEWTDALDLASSTPKINLAPQIENLQRIKREMTPL